MATKKQTKTTKQTMRVEAYNLRVGDEIQMGNNFVAIDDIVEGRGEVEAFLNGCTIGLFRSYVKVTIRR